ncbi:hypothetical protein AN403_3220 [Pseudomonas fluorescens]|uniref:Uncharacterized protein n=1 Tax=Pseudomonas fluorescens TaxID=294 RepID=A0A0N8NX99_PSEFL|nr:hypothetical protein [Pseudomonas fluorescens]KPU59609.1 hypothetical protein AN403_3220 [Pseudomonas fluorescens]
MAFSVVINSGSILLLSTTLSPAVRQDSLDTVLFAQLAADEDFPDGGTHAQWAEVLVDTLVACGWKLYDQGRTSGMFPAADVRFFSVHEAIHAAFQSRLSAEQIVLMTRVLRMVAQLPEQSAAAVLLRGQSIMGVETQTASTEGNYSGNSHHRVRVLAGIVEADGFLTMASVSFETVEPIDSQFLGQDFTMNRIVGGVSTAFFHSRFSMDEYKAYREDTVRWLGPQRQALCIKVDEHDLQRFR